MLEAEYAGSKGCSSSLESSWSSWRVSVSTALSWLVLLARLL